MAWKGAMLTDSGGFQVFSLAKLRKINDNGVEFNSHIDGTKYFFTPKSVIEAEHIIGADFIMCLDECSNMTRVINMLKKLWSELINGQKNAKNIMMEDLFTCTCANININNEQYKEEYILY